MLPPRDNDLLDRVRGLERRVRWLKTRKPGSGSSGAYSQDDPVLYHLNDYVNSDNWAADSEGYLWHGNRRVWARGSITNFPTEEDYGNVPHIVIIPNAAEVTGGMAGQPLPDFLRPARDLYLPVYSVNGTDGPWLHTTKLSIDGSWRFIDMGGQMTWLDARFVIHINLSAVGWPLT